VDILPFILIFTAAILIACLIAYFHVPASKFYDDGINFLTRKGFKDSPNHLPEGIGLLHSCCKFKNFVEILEDQIIIWWANFVSKDGRVYSFPRAKLFEKNANPEVKKKCKRVRIVRSAQG